MKINGAIFDLDGTLVDSMIWWETIWDVVSRAHFDGKPCRPDRETEEKLHTLAVGESVKLLCGYYAEKMGVVIDAADLERTLNDDIDDLYRNRLKPKRGVPEFLSYLHQKGIPICVASASERENVEIALACCGLDRFVSHIFTCTEVGKSKSYPDIYYTARNTLGTPMESTWVFEDAYRAICTATAAGFHTVGIYEAQESHYDEMKQTATVYVDRGESMEKLIPLFEM
ncbi:MAG: HAD family phosphatase [Ruminococcaceae bacterium]|nr:HAD family phosphatase [Oscillospiraceae bacterium]